MVQSDMNDTVFYFYADALMTLFAFSHASLNVYSPRMRGDQPKRTSEVLAK